LERFFLDKKQSQTKDKQLETNNIKE